MTKASFFSGVEQSAIKFKSFKAKNPLFFFDLHAMGGVFLADLKGVKSVLPKEYNPVQPFPHKALLAIHCMEYRHTDIKAYNEVAISVVMESPGWIVPGSVKTLMDIVSQNYHVFITDLPVSTEISKAGGIRFFKFPKFLADIEFRETAKHRICTVRDKKTLKLILEFECKKIRTRQVRQDKNKDIVTLHMYSDAQAPGLRGQFRVNVIERGISLFMPNVSLRYGKHPMAERIQALKPGMLLQTLYAPKCEAILYPREL